MNSPHRTSLTAICLAFIASFAGLPARALADNISMGTAGAFAVLAGTRVINKGTSVIDGGNVGVSPGRLIFGAPSLIVVPPYQIGAGDPTAYQAQADLAIAYRAAEQLAATQDLSGHDLGGLTLLPGVYSFATTAQLTGRLTLDDRGDPAAQFVFQVRSDLQAANFSSIVMMDGRPMSGCSVYWQVGGSALLGKSAEFTGHILAQRNISLDAGASLLNGSALAHQGAVSLTSSRITNCLPEPTTANFVLLGGVILLNQRKPRLRAARRHRLNRRPGWSTWVPSE